ncbi:MAG: hypothetical protein GWN54_12195, partial [Gammaproteobacteria bacterium]|nr:hypothetical protein [Gammaproteobacteria bacterium]
LDADRAEPADAVILPAEEAPWYSRLRWWLAGLPVLLVAALVWWLRSRPSGETPAAEIVDAEPAATPGDGQAQEPGDSDKIVELGRFKDPPARA